MELILSLKYGWFCFHKLVQFYCHGGWFFCTELKSIIFIFEGIIGWIKFKRYTFQRNVTFKNILEEWKNSIGCIKIIVMLCSIFYSKSFIIFWNHYLSQRSFIVFSRNYKIKIKINLCIVFLQIILVFKHTYTYQYVVLFIISWYLNSVKV